ncbi:MAG: cellulase family glycosylhydrolase [Oscillospiraceae bacterium]|nr:cellulase family glycosylhydrolase [Oscillospiraceae bacterium]
MKEFLGFRKGVNLGGWLSQAYSQTEEYYSTFINKSDIERIASWGVDHVRLPIDYCLVETQEGEPIESGFRHIDNCIAWCKEYGLNLVLDLHKTAGYAFDELESAGVFFDDAKLQQRFIELWVKLSKRYGGYEFIAFELLNEVVLLDVTEKWNEIIKAVITEIRKSAPKTKIIVGGVCYNSPLTIAALDKPYDENIVYNFHCYEPLLFTHQNAPWIANMPLDLKVEYPQIADVYEQNSSFLTKEMSISLAKFGKQLFLENNGAAFFENIFEEALKVAEERNVPLYCGEYGVIDRAPLQGTLNWYKDINSVFEKHQIGRAMWTYKQLDFGIIDEHYAPIFEELVKVI